MCASVTWSVAQPGNPAERDLPERKHKRTPHGDLGPLELLIVLTEPVTAGESPGHVL